MKESFRAFIVEKWVPALRSGEYTQGVGGLCVPLGETEYTYCCLGVACDFTCKRLGRAFYHPDDFIPANSDPSSAYALHIVTTSVLPSKLAQEFGITPDGGFHQIRGTMDVLGVYNIHNSYVTSLVDANDGALWSFDQIADLLENMASDNPSYEFEHNSAVM